MPEIFHPFHPFSELECAQIEGPEISWGSGANGGPRHPLWRIAITIQPFDDPVPHSSIDESYPRANTVHPLISLAIDHKETKLLASEYPNSIEEDGNQPLANAFVRADSPVKFRVPRLFSAHVVAGKNPYEEHYHDDRWTGLVQDERLQVLIKGGKFPHFRARMDLRNVIKAFGVSYDLAFQSKPGEQAGVPGFDHVVLSPINYGDQNWPPPVSDFDPQVGHYSVHHWIVAPRFRLQNGEINIEVIEDGDFKLFKSLGLEIADNCIRLSPEGIVFHGKAPFPGTDEKLPGVFLFTEEPVPENDSETRFVLKLLPDRMDEDMSVKWMAAWRRITPRSGPAGSQEPWSARFVAARRRDAPPAFVWALTLRNDGTFEPVGKTIEVPPSDVLFAFRGSTSSVTGEADGIADLQPALVKVLQGQTVDQVKFEISQTFEEALDTKIKYEFDRTGGKPESIDIESGAGTFLVHDERALAAQLRAAYGLTEPKYLLNRPADDRAPDAERPYLFGFVPMVGGWLQIPLPNFETLNTEQDFELLHGMVGEAGTALPSAVHFSNRTTLSAPHTFTTTVNDIIGDEAPWRLAVTEAHGFKGTWTVSCSDESWSTDKVDLKFSRPQISCRGLFWLSADRPDAVEGIPRYAAGPGKFIDVPLRSMRKKPVQENTEQENSNKSLQTVTLRLKDLAIRLKKSGDAVHASLKQHSLSIAWNKEAGDWENLLKDKVAKNAADRVKKATDAGQGNPVPPLAWMRHGELPLITAMPMTRTVDNATRPLESRELSAFRVASTKPVQLEWKNETSPWAAVNTIGLKYHRLEAWKWPEKEYAPSPHGLPMICVSVPGVEIIPNSNKANVWNKIEFNYRYDIPVLDEAFATAALPPSADANANGSNGEGAGDRDSPPLPNALDLPGLAAFWNQQQIRHELSRVRESYLVWYSDFDAEYGSPLAGARWNLKVTFDGEAQHNNLLYGQVKFVESGQEIAAQSGNEAAKGLSGNLSLSYENGVPVINYASSPDNEPAHHVMSMRGWGLSTFKDDRGLVVDNRFLGAADAVKNADENTHDLITRKVRQRKGTDIRDILAVTLKEALQIDIGGRKCRFWMRDVPTNEAGAYDNPLDEGENIDPSAWTDDRLTENGFEWRFYLEDGQIAEHKKAPALVEKFRFQGFILEPLQLRKLRVDHTSGKVEQIVILARAELPQLTNQHEPAGNRLLLTFKAAANGGSGLVLADCKNLDRLEFELSASDLLRPRRRVNLKTDLEYDSNNGDVAIRLINSKVSLRLFGVDLELDAHGEIDRDADCITFDVGAIAISQVPAAGSAGIELGPSTLTISTDNDDFVSARIEMLPAIHVRPVSDAGEQNLVDPAQILLEFTLNDRSEAKSKLKASLQILGIRIKDIDVSLFEDSNALSVTFDEIENIDGNLCKGWPFHRDRVSKALLASGMLAMTFRPRAEGSPYFIDAAVGRIEVLVHQPDQKTLIEVESSDERAWIGDIRVWGGLTASNAIQWPRNVKPTPDTPPPASADLDGGVVKIEINAEHDKPKGAFEHSTVFLFDGHRLPFDKFSQGGEGQPMLKSTWNVLVRAVHTLSWGTGEEKKELSWSGIDHFALGSIQDLAEPFEHQYNENDDKYASAHVAFSPQGHYDNWIGPKRNFLKETNKVHMGFGLIDRTLGGQFARDFRTKLAEQLENDPRKETDPLVLVSGFVGFIGDDGEDVPERLVRVPVVARIWDETQGGGSNVLLSKGSLQQYLDDEQTELTVAWPGSGVDLPVQVQKKSAVTLAQGTGDRLNEILLGNTDEPAETFQNPVVHPAMPVEQVVLAPPVELVELPPPFDYLDVDEELRLGLFWPGATVSVWRLVNARGLKRLNRYQALSLVSGSVEVGSRRLTSAALVRTGTPAIGEVSALPGPNLKDALITGDERVLVEAWDVGKVDAGAKAAARMAALERHLRPAFAVIRAVSSLGHVTYENVRMPPGASLELPRRRKEKRGSVYYQDAQRGFPMPPSGGHKAPDWVAGVAMGHTAPRRDDSEGGFGYAGTATSMNAPAHAGPESKLTLRKLEHLDKVVWLSEKRVPPYLTVSDEKFSAPPVQSLTPARTRIRLPAEETLANGLMEHNSTGKVQSFFPPALSTLSVADRAGVLMARRVSLYSAIGDQAAFDPAYPRTGVPGQASSSVVRQVRTPRPGPIAENRNGMEAFWRRLHPSPLENRENAKFIFGPADVVRGTHPENGNWRAVFTAMPKSQGIVTDNWDGVAQVLVDMLVDKHIADADEAKKFAWSRLFDRISEEEGNTEPLTRDIVSLHTFGRVLPYGKIKLDRMELEHSQHTDPQDGDTVYKFTRIRLTILLEPFAGIEPGANDNPWRQLGDHLSRLDNQTTELKLTIHPDAARAPFDLPDPLRVSLSRRSENIPSGETRPPMTLGLPLSVVRMGTGALPLVPASVVFSDPAYDRQLGNRAHQVIEATNHAVPGRGRLRWVFSADRNAYTVDGAIVLMCDLQFETPRDPNVKKPKDQTDIIDPNIDPRGDVAWLDEAERSHLNSCIRVAADVIRSPDGVKEKLQISPQILDLNAKLGVVYELSIADFVTMDGKKPAKLKPGDVLRLSFIKTVDSYLLKVFDGTTSRPGKVSVEFLGTAMFIELTDEPPVTPPPSAYSVLRNLENTLSVPLHAQSPLPERVDFDNLRSDFRLGMVTRNATYSWLTSVPKQWTGPGKVSAFVVKIERNGQHYLAEKSEEFAPLVKLDAGIGGGTLSR